MNKSKALMAGAAIVALSTPLAAKDAKAASATIAAEAIVVDAIVLSAGVGIHFGTMSISALGTITVSAAGAQSAGSGGVNPLASSSAERAGTFTIQADNRQVDFTTNLPVNLTTDLSLTAVNITGAGMALSFTGVGPVSGTPAGATTTAETLNVGGTLSAAAAIPGGNYSGNFVLTANYN